MTPEKLKKILAEYAALLHPGERMPESGYPVRAFLEGWRRTLVEGHLHWMCQEAQAFPEKNKVEKAMRWLGFVQGVLWCLGDKSLDDLRDDSKPDEEQFLTTKVKEEFAEAASKIPPEAFEKLIQNDGAKTGRFNSVVENKNNHPNSKEVK
jgi:hypothetical protein